MTPTRSAPVFALVLALGLVAPAADLVPLAGTPTGGTLVAIDAQFVTFKTDSGTVVKMPVKDVAAVDLKNKPLPPEPKFDEIELTDGSVLRVSAVQIKGKAVTPTLAAGAGAPGPTIELPLGAVFSLMRGAEDDKVRAEWKKLLAGRGKRDLFVVRQADGLNPLPGTVLEGNETGDRVSFEREDGNKVNLPLTRATGGLVFNQPPKDVIPPTVCRVIDVAGNTWFATAVEVAGSGLKVKTVSGATVTYPALAGVSKLDFSRGNVAYLSDLEATADAPPAAKDEPLELRYAKDRPVIGADIAFDGRKFAKGVAVPRDTTLTYKLDGGGYREFKAVAGIPDGQNRTSWALRLRVEMDGRAVIDEVVAKKEKPKELNLNVKDAKELKITVTAEGLTGLGFELDLGDARLQK